MLTDYMKLVILQLVKQSPDCYKSRGLTRAATWIHPHSRAIFLKIRCLWDYATSSKLAVPVACEVTGI